jgi:hypothetical protein
MGESDDIHRTRPSASRTTGRVPRVPPRQLLTTPHARPGQFAGFCRLLASSSTTATRSPFGSRTYLPVLRQADIPDVTRSLAGSRRLHFEYD